MGWQVKRATAPPQIMPFLEVLVPTAIKTGRGILMEKHFVFEDSLVAIKEKNYSSVSIL